jgi:hypothetical protein
LTDDRHDSGPAFSPLIGVCSQAKSAYQSGPFVCKITGKENAMKEPHRVTPQEIYPKVQSGEALLVCAYDDDAKFQRLRLHGAISLTDFKSRLPILPKDREIVFYCA